MKKLKARATDYTYDDLPKNRKEVFFDVIKNQWRKLLFLGFLLLLAFLPYLLIIFFRDYYLLGVSKALSEKTISSEDAYKLYCISHLIASGCSWVSFYYSAIFIGAISRIVRNLVWQDPVFLKEDIVLGIKQNYKFGAIVATFFGIALVTSRLVLFVTNNTILQSLPLAIFIPVLVPPLFITYVEGTIYNGSFKSLFRNGTLMYIKRVPHALLFTILLLSPMFYKLIQSYIIVKYMCLFFTILFLSIFFVVMFYLFSNYLFDLYINPTYYPEMYRKGMSKEE